MKRKIAEDEVEAFFGEGERFLIGDESRPAIGVMRHVCHGRGKIGLQELPEGLRVPRAFHTATALRSLDANGNDRRDPGDDLLESTRTCPRCDGWMARSGLGEEGSVGLLLEGGYLAGAVLHLCLQCSTVEFEAVP